ncbi:leucine-rich repeat-containing protein 59 isoform X2 [Neodiprion pinetum]|uniref:leucine-rich repeat-containing protein 59 isoform X2 n=2 Tax=Neodiprion pinetum TaxID=441929 RepID=UPI00371EA264
MERGLQGCRRINLQSGFSTADMSSRMNLKDKLQDDTLDLSMSDLQEVPVKDIAVIRKASHLDLSNNRLVSLPKTFATLTHIVKLDLSKNQLTELPENFGDMRQLKYLDLYSNNISRLPLSLGELKNLKWLDLKENPLTPGVASVAGLCSNAKECQACARNVVAYLSSAKRAIDEEQQRRIIAIAAVEAEKGAAPTKKDGKKKKKKAEHKESRSQLDRENSAGLKSDRQKTNGHTSALRLKSEYKNTYGLSSSPRDGIAGRLCRGLIKLFFWLIAISILVVLGLVLLPLFDKKRADSISDYLELQTGQPVRYYQQSSSEYLDKFIDNVILWTEQAQIVLKEIYSKYFAIGSSLKNDL